MQFFLQILLLLWFNVSFAQNNDNSGLLQLSPFNLGDSVISIQGNILCIDADKTRPCEMYRYLHGIDKPTIIAGISFDDIQIFVGKKQVVKNIYLIKKYKGADS